MEQKFSFLEKLCVIAILYFFIIAMGVWGYGDMMLEMGNTSFDQMQNGIDGAKEFLKCTPFYIYLYWSRMRKERKN